jgi:hypothetical protein
MFDEMVPFLKDEIININKVGATCDRSHIRYMVYIFLMRSADKRPADHSILDSIIDYYLSKGYISCDANGNFFA